MNLRYSFRPNFIFISRNSLKPVCLIASFLASGIVFWPGITSFFVSDDYLFIHTIAQRGFEPVWSISSERFVRPVVWLFFWIDYQWFRLNPLGYHCTNLVFHGFNSWLVWRIAKHLFSFHPLLVHQAERLAMGTACLFLLLPSHSEAVVWISGRADVIAATWGLLSLGGYLAYRTKHQYRYLMFSTVSFGIGLLTKESLVTYPLLIWAFETIWFKGRPNRVSLLFLESHFVSCWLVYGIFRWLYLGSWVGGYGLDIHFQTDPSWLYRNFIFFTTRSLIPMNEWISQTKLMTYGSAVLILIGVGMISSALVGIYCKRRMQRTAVIDATRWIVGLSTMYLISLLPVLSLPLHIGGVFGERLTYWPGIFLLILVVAGIGMSIRWKSVLSITLTILMVLCGISLYRINWRWNDAGREARSIVQDIESFDLSEVETLILFNLPDHFRGVYVFRNGIERALNAFNPSRPPSNTHVVALQSVFDAADGVSIRHLGEGRFEITSSGYRTYFIRYTQTKISQSLYTLVEMNPNRYIIETSRHTEPYRYAYWSGGRVWLYER